MNTKNLRTWAEIDMTAARGNFDGIRRHVPSDVKLMAIIKADAYGHGAVKFAKMLSSTADYYGVAMADEGYELRMAGVSAPILILGYTQPSLFPMLVKNKICPAIFHMNDAKKLNECAKSLGTVADFHIVIDTGMSRIGFALTDESVAEIKKISEMKNIRIAGMFSHFATADSSDKTYAKVQRERYVDFSTRLIAKGVEVPLKHLYNSAATMELEPMFDMMREGIILYGLRPSYDVNMNIIPELKAVMSLRSRVGHVKTLEAGVAISYGCTYVTTKETRVATVCAGYADGVPRVISGKGSVLIHGKKAPIIGRICMDQFMIDVTDIDGVAVDDVVTVFGRDGDEEIFADDIATLAGTIGYELTCGITKRVPRVYMENGKITDIHYGIPHME